MERSYKSEDFTILKTVNQKSDGCGSELAISLNDNKIYRIKSYEIKKTGFKAAEIQNKVNNEIKTGKIAKHENLVELLGWYQRGKEICFVFSFSELGTLESYYKKQTFLYELEAISIFDQILEGLHYLHVQGYLHRDVRPHNILIFKNEKTLYKLSDYDFAKFIAYAETKNIGTPFYLAPEILNESKTYSEKIDYWSLGVLLYEILQGKLPWKITTDATNEKMEREINDFIFDRHEFIRMVTPEAKDLLKALLQKDPFQRFGYWKLKNLPIYKKALEDFQKIGALEKLYKNEWYYVEKHKKNWVKNPVQQIIHYNLIDEFGIFPISLREVNSAKIDEMIGVCQQEIDLGNTFIHENAKPLHNYFLTSDKKYLNLIYPYTSTGRLSETLQSGGKFTEKNTSRMILQIIEGINFLHELNLLHLNIKPENIGLFIKDDGTKIYSLIGYGIVNAGEKKLNVNNEYLFYQSPEIYKEQSPNHRADYWSFGVMIYEIITGKLPWKTTQIDSEVAKTKLFEEITHFDVEIIEKDNSISNDVKKLLKELLQIDPSARIGYFDIKNSEFVKKYFKKKKISDGIQVFESGDPNMQSSSLFG